MADTISSWLSTTVHRLETAGIETPRLDALVLLSDELGCDKAWLLAHPEHALQGSVVKNLNTNVTQRAQHVPLAYIRGKVEFYGREFVVNEHVLVPRPESEAMIVLLKRSMLAEPHTAVIDIGTGCGALAITAKLECPASKIAATDIDNECLKVAAQNAASLGADISLLQGDLLEPFQGSKLQIRNSIILANLPYVPENYPVNTAATHEPELALYGGGDGLAVYRRLFEQINEHGLQPYCIITESLEHQHEMLTEMAHSHGFDHVTTNGLAQCFARPTRFK
ncbi:peptide chain release factor N(5)-glutamine methyltransferase [Candidatus Saccharibacteria bacterium]|nr:MAG: peptide chain release factor N(5)-glutamine methyltransferase [Candidatus Saccharibacteria bacterium]